MKIINLTQTQYRNYSNIHNDRNIGQTIEFTQLNEYKDKNKFFLGLIDDSDNVLAATIIIISNISPTLKEAYAPDGFLIDYSNYQLVDDFVHELRKFLLKEKVVYLITDPVFRYRVYNKKTIMIQNNDGIYNNLIKLDFKPLGYESDFAKYDVIIDNNIGSDDIYYNFNRNTKRNIKESINMGITLKKGNISNIEEFYNIIKKKTKKKLSHYVDFMNAYNTQDNKMDIFFTKINTHKFLVNSKKIYEKEKNKNELLVNNMQKHIGHINEKELNKKIASDHLLEKCSQNLKLATKLAQTENDEITVGTSAIIRNNKEIYFLIDGYKEELRSIHSSHVLKWALIKKYYSLGYRTFNLGEINNNYQDTTGKYHGQYMYKIGFGGNIIEYPPTLLLVINKYVYSTYTKLNIIKFKKY